MTHANVTWSPLPTDNETTIICQNDQGDVMMSGGLYPVGLTHLTCNVTNCNETSNETCISIDTASNITGCNFTITVIGTYFLSSLFTPTFYNVLL